MRYRAFGKTPLQVSELGFGGWAIGGASFGAVVESESLAALARAEDLGCNFVDTAAVYGDSERVLGRFLKGRRQEWIISSKFSGQPAGLAATLEEQLRRLGTDHIDFYQLHWAPSGQESRLYDELARLRDAGKVRFIGVSVYSAADIDDVLARDVVDGLQVCFGLLDPFPLLRRLAAVRTFRPGIIARSVLKHGFLSGKYSATSRFTDPSDQRSRWGRGQIRATARAADRMRFLETDARSLLAGAVRYPLAFPEVSTVVLSTKTREQATDNFLHCQNGDLTADELARVRDVQASLGLLSVSPLARARETARHIWQSLARRR